MNDRRFLLLLQACAVGTTGVVAFVSTASRTVHSPAVGSVSRTAFFATTTTNPEEWELPDELPGDDEGGMRRNKDGKKRSAASKGSKVEELFFSTSKYATGDELHHLRNEVMDLRSDLEEARMEGNTRRALELEHAVLRAQARDAEFMYAVLVERMQSAKALGNVDEAEQILQEALEARAALPQFNLEGLWVGKYGDNGYEMINVTYAGDVLLAYKVTGDKNVPKGELSFRVDLSPASANNNNKKKNKMLEPIELGDYASEQWGTKFLNRFSGRGQVAGEGFTNPQFMDGQLILVNEYFSFAWIPIGHQVFFGRPSAELTLKLLRESNSDVDNDRAHLERCLEETHHFQEDFEDSSVSMNQEDYYALDGSFE